MALWAKTDQEASKPKYLSAADKAVTFFVSQEEAQLASNKKKGINGAGWWKIVEQKDNSGQSRYKTELLIAMSVANATSGDEADDATVADIEAVVTISAQPTAQNTSSGGATFSVTATVAPSGTVTFQWQRAAAATPTRFSNVSGATSSSLALTGRTGANSGDVYRVVLSSTTGAPKLNSSEVALTFVS